MKTIITFFVSAVALGAILTVPVFAEEKPAAADPHGWIGTETVKTRFGDFEFKNGYPTPAAADALLDQLKFNRAIEVYLTQMPAVAIIESRQGLRDFGAKRSNQVVIWESLMDAKTLVLTANTETVYGMGFLDLKSDGATVVEAPPKMLGAAMDTLQRFLVDIGPLGPDKGKGGKYLFLPPGYTGDVPEGYFVIKSPTYSVSYFVRGFKVDGKTDQAVALMKQIKVYPLAKAADAPKMEFLNGSGQPIDTIHSDTITFFEMLSQLVNEEPADVFTPLERFTCRPSASRRTSRSIPTRRSKALLAEAARAGAAMARANSFASRDADTYYYPDRKWQFVGDVPYNFMKDGVLQVDRRAYVYYMAVGNSPAMMAKNVGVGSYYLWTYKDGAGELPRRREELQAAHSRQSARQGFLVGAGLRFAQPFGVAERPEVSLGQPVQRTRRAMPTARWTSTSVPRCRRARRRTGSRPCPAKAGSRSSASTARWNRSSTRRGSCQTSRR